MVVDMDMEEDMVMEGKDTVMVGLVGAMRSIIENIFDPVKFSSTTKVIIYTTKRNSSHLSVKTKNLAL